MKVYKIFTMNYWSKMGELCNALTRGVRVMSPADFNEIARKRSLRAH